MNAPLNIGHLADGRSIKFGRLQEKAPGPHFRLRRYLLAGLPDEPATLDYTQGASTSAALANIDGNDTLGDCVIAWLYHQLALWTGNATGVAYQPTLAQVIAMYGAIGGYVPGDPSTDNGCDMTTAMNWIVANGYANGDKPAGWVRIDGTNAKELRQAIWLFGGNGFGVGLPDAYVAAMQTMTSGFTWDVAGPANPNNGHAFLGAGYNAKGVIIDTWGMVGTFTYAAIAQLAVAASGGEIDILLSHDQIAAAASKAPNGVDWVGLVADFDEIGGSVPIPAPPSPGPTGPTGPGPTGPTGPAPSTLVTLAQAQAWAAAGINSGRWLMDRAQAIAAANAGLAKGWPKS